MRQNGEEYLHPEVFLKVMEKYSVLCARNAKINKPAMWQAAVRITRIDMMLDTIKFLRDNEIYGYCK